MTSSYEQRIVEAMLRRSEALEMGDDNAAAEALVAAGNAAAEMRSRRKEQVLDIASASEVAEAWARERNRLSLAGEVYAAKLAADEEMKWRQRAARESAVKP